MFKKTIITVLCISLLLVPLSACSEVEPLIDSKNQPTNEITVSTDTYPIDLNPYTSTDQDTETIFNSLYEGLVSLDTSGQPTLKEAKDITLSEDKLTVKITLKDNIKYSDGKEVTAQDYVQAWQTAVSPNTNCAYSYMFDSIQNGYEIRKGTKSPDELGVTSTDDKTLQIQLTAPYDKFVDMLSFQVFYPIKINSTGNIIGNGPYKVDTYQPNTSLCLAKNNNYYNYNKLDLDKIEFSLTQERVDSKKTFIEDDFQFTDNLDEDKLSVLSKYDEFNCEPTLSTVCLSFQNAKAPYDNVEIRKALSESIDRNQLVNMDISGKSVAASAIIPTGIEDVADDSDFRDYKSSYFATDSSGKGEAKQYLSKNGYPNGKGFPTIDLVYDKTKYEDQAELIQKMWYDNLGVTAKLVGLDTDSFYYAIETGDYDVAITTSTAKYDDPLTILDTFVSDNTFNYERYISEDYDTKIAEAKVTQSSEERYALLHESEDILMSELPCTPLYFGRNTYLKDTSLNNVLVSPMGYYDFSFAKIGDTSENTN